MSNYLKNFCLCKSISSSLRNRIIFQLTSLGLLWFLFLIPFFGSFGFFLCVGSTCNLLHLVPFFQFNEFFPPFSFPAPSDSYKGQPAACQGGQLRMLVAFGSPEFPFISGVINRASRGVTWIGGGYSPLPSDSAATPWICASIRNMHLFCPSIAGPFNCCVYGQAYNIFWQDGQIEKRRTKCKVRVCFCKWHHLQQCECWWQLFLQLHWTKIEILQLLVNTLSCWPGVVTSRCIILINR